MAKVQKIAAKVEKPAKRGRKPLTEAEKAKDARFIRVAGIRTAKVLKLCKGLQACANTLVYEYSDAQVSAMLKALRRAVDKVERAYTSPEGKRASTVTKVESFFVTNGIK